MSKSRPKCRTACRASSPPPFPGAGSCTPRLITNDTVSSPARPVTESTRARNRPMFYCPDWIRAGPATVTRTGATKPAPAGSITAASRATRITAHRRTSDRAFPWMNSSRPGGWTNDRRVPCAGCHAHARVGMCRARRWQTSRPTVANVARDEPAAGRLQPEGLKESSRWQVRRRRMPPPDGSR